MKTLVAVRMEADPLDALRDHARQQNRTLTNFIETVLRKKVAPSASLTGSEAMVKSEYAPFDAR